MTAQAGSPLTRFLALGVGEIGARLVAFGVTVYVARTVGAEHYGVLVAAITVVMYLTFVVDAGMDMVGVKQVTAHPERVPELLASVLGARLLIAIATIICTAAFALAALPRVDGLALALYAGTLLATAISTKFVHLGIDRAGNTAWSRVLGESIMAALVLLLVRQPADLLKIPAAQIAGDLVAALLLLSLLPVGRRPHALRLEMGSTLALLRDARPMVLHGLLGLAIFNSDFLFLRVLQDSESVGYYSVAYTLISFAQNLGVAYTMSLIPTFTVARDDRAAAQRAVDNGMGQALLGALPVTVGGLLVAPALVHLLFGPSYAPSARPLQILLLLVPVSLVRNVWQAVLVAYNRQDLMLRTVAWAAAVNVVLNVALIPRYGMVGAAVATVVTEGIRTWLSARYAKGLSLAMPAGTRFARIGVAAVGMAAVTWGALAAPVLVTVGVSAATYVLLLVVTGAVRLRGGRPEFSF